jgi:hypothetical protein
MAIEIKNRTIVLREEQANTITYYILQGDHLHEVKIENGAVSCNCHAYLYSARGNKHCGDTEMAQQNEPERGTDIQQHLADEQIVYTCVACSNRVKAANTYCFGCLA